MTESCRDKWNDLCIEAIGAIKLLRQGIEVRLDEAAVDEEMNAALDKQRWFDLRQVVQGLTVVEKPLVNVVEWLHVAEKGGDD